MYGPLYTRETAHWYALLGSVQAQNRRFIEQEVESYLVHLLQYMSGNISSTNRRVLTGVKAEFQPAREKHLVKVQEVAEQCLLVAGLFPEYARKSGISLVHFMENGHRAYQDLANAVPESKVYVYIAGHFVEVIDILQRLGELCGACYPLDLIQACELWQETGSHHGLEFIINKTKSLPITQSSELRH